MDVRRPGAHPKVMVVEDESLIGMVLMDLVEQAGCVALGLYRTAAEALAALEMERPHAALLDVTLADGPALPVAEALASLDVPFAVVIGDVQALDPVYANAPTIEKPFNEAELGRALAGVLTPRVEPVGRAVAGSADRILAIVLEYEAATNKALQALDGTDRRRQLLTCLRWADAAGALNTLSGIDRNLVGELLLQHGNVPHHTWPRIMAALEAFEAERAPEGPGSAR